MDKKSLKHISKHIDKDTVKILILMIFLAFFLMDKTLFNNLIMHKMVVIIPRMDNIRIDNKWDLSDSCP